MDIIILLHHIRIVVWYRIDAIPPAIVVIHCTAIVLTVYYAFIYTQHAGCDTRPRETTSDFGVASIEMVYTRYRDFFFLNIQWKLSNRYDRVTPGARLRSSRRPAQSNKFYRRLVIITTWKSFQRVARFRHHPWKILPPSTISYKPYFSPTSLWNETSRSWRCGIDAIRRRNLYPGHVLFARLSTGKRPLRRIPHNAKFVLLKINGRLFKNKNTM